MVKLRGAARVVGVDRRNDRIQQAQLVRDITGVDVDFRVADGHDLDERLGVFDITLNTGVVYHLQDPMHFLGRMSRITREAMYVESELLRDPRYAECASFIEREYLGDPSNWWIFGPQCLERMLRAAGFPRVEFRGFTALPPSGTRTPEGFERQGRGVFTCYK